MKNSPILSGHEYSQPVRMGLENCIGGRENTSGCSHITPLKLSARPTPFHVPSALQVSEKAGKRLIMCPVTMSTTQNENPRQLALAQPLPLLATLSGMSSSQGCAAKTLAEHLEGPQAERAR
ncbi:hypothetical protein PENTCL1PPCAC_10004, partial [Pristionchus entomophagus]